MAAFPITAAGKEVALEIVGGVDEGRDVLGVEEALPHDEAVALVLLLLGRCQSHGSSIPL